jgi:uncharacterized membrane protein affecting hemolysin expression
MTQKTLHRSALAGMLIVTFALGFFSGSISQRQANAQVKELGGALMKQAAGSGTLGPAGDLGTSILDMQEHVSGLQKNIDMLKKVQSALTGK